MLNLFDGKPVAGLRKRQGLRLLVIVTPSLKWGAMDTIGNFVLRETHFMNVRHYVNHVLKFSAILTVIVHLSAGCTPASTGWKPDETRVADEKAEREEMTKKVAAAIQAFRDVDPGMKTFFDKAYGYVVFPTIGKGAVGLGGAYGSGHVFEKSRVIGRASMTQVTFGLQLGGQAYSEIIFFKDHAALVDFVAGKYKFDSQVSAVAVTYGASANVAYSDGVAVFTLTKGGMMFEASVGGQKFSFEPFKMGK